MNRLTDAEFVPQGQALQVGKSSRFPHCNQNKTMVVSRAADRITARCFRCDASGIHDEQESIADRLVRLTIERNADANAMRSTVLPEPRVYTLKDWPKDSALWLYKAGFSPSMIADMGVYWCPSLGRVVLPVIKDGHAVFWQARSVRRKPKVLNPIMDRRGLVAKYGRGDTIVLCEDMLSAYKVGRETEAWSLLGTKLLAAPLAELITQDKPVVVWLDPDGPGQTAAAKITKTLRAYGVDVRNVVTPLDPKLYDRAFIQGVLHA